MNHKPEIIALIPAYNEEASIARVVRGAKTQVSRVIVCDDGSEDRTHKIAKTSGATVLRHKQNMGYGAALSTLFAEAKKLDPDVAVTLDADGQHDPSYIPKLIQPILSGGADIVIGSRFLSSDGQKSLPPYRKLGIRIVTILYNVLFFEDITDAQSGFRAYGRVALRAVKPSEDSMGVSTEILIKAKRANLRVKEVSVKISYEGNTSKKNPIPHLFEVIASTIRYAVK